MGFLRSLEALLIAALGVLVTVGIAVWVLTMPWFTSAVVPRVITPEAASLEQDQMVDLAQDVRLFVTTRSAPPLPATVAGREGFDEAAVGHLEDVRVVLLRARGVTLISVVLLVLAVGQSLLTGWDRVAESGLRLGGWVSLGGVAFVMFFGSADFDRLFTAFHNVFFEPGTWVFSSNALLIQLFPESFWSIAGIVLGIVVGVGAAGLIVAGRISGSSS